MSDFFAAPLDDAHRAEARALWRDVAAWLRSRDMALWDPDLFDDAFFDEALRVGEVVGVFAERELAAVALLQWSDELWWPDRPSEAAAYVHKVVVARPFAGSRAVDTLFDACRSRARAHGKTLLRLDTPSDRAALHRLYERLGFTEIDTRRVDSIVVKRYEMPIAQS